MALLPAHDHLSPPASALPLPQCARAWKRFICATHIYGMLLCVHGIDGAVTASQVLSYSFSLEQWKLL